MTKRPDAGENVGKEALNSISARPDARIRALARLLARHTAQQDFARYLEQLGKAHPSSTTDEERR